MRTRAMPRRTDLRVIRTASLRRKGLADARYLHRKVGRTIASLRQGVNADTVPQAGEEADVASGKRSASRCSSSCNGTAGCSDLADAASCQLQGSSLLLNHLYRL